MQNHSINTDESGKELNEHGTPLYPLAGYDEYFSKFTLKEVPWHWHPEIELIIVKEGATQIHCLDSHFPLHPGECLFINSNVLHRMTQLGNTDCHIINFVLNPEFIGGKSDSLIYQNYVKPICQNTCINTIKLTPCIPWENDAIISMEKAFNLYTNNGYGHEMLIRAELTKFWHNLCHNTQEIQNNQHTSNDIADQRISKIMKYIHNHISDKLTVYGIASSASISESECFRLFRVKLDKTPMEYILFHRLQVAATMLIETSDSIINISLATGFGSPSYFSKKFKEYYNLSPRLFRDSHL